MIEAAHEICRASAGSGKTYQLTGRYLAMLYGGVDPKTILATTFTRKAAGEILSRVLGRLAEAAADETKRQELSQFIGAKLRHEDCLRMLRGLTQSLHQLSIGTLDSFFSRIAQCFSLELSLPPEPILIDERSAAAEQLRRDAIEAMLGDDDLPTLLDLLRRLHHDTARRSVTEAIDDVISKMHATYRDAPDRALWTQLRVQNLLEDDEFSRLIEQLANYDPSSLGKRWITALTQTCADLHARNWEQSLKRGFVKAYSTGTFYSKPIPDAMNELLDPIARHVIAAIQQRVARRTEALFDLLHRFDAHVARLKQQQGILLFSDITHRLAKVLPTLGDEVLLDVYYRLDGRVQHLMLDEFQDTSLDQWAILEPIAREITSDASGDRSFYSVGDVKQAIYGWRGGCAELFDRIENELGDGQLPVKTLPKNYRSSQVVLDVVNDVFGSLAGNAVFTDEADRDVACTWEKRYESHTAARDLPGHVLLKTTPTAEQDDVALDADGEAIDDLEPASAHERCVAQYIAELHAQAPQCSIGVLVQKNAVIAKLLFELYQLGVDASGEGGNTIADAPAVSAVLSALVMADHPSHTAAVFHVVNSPVGQMLDLTRTDPAAVRSVALRLRKRLASEGYPAVLADWTAQLASSCDADNLSKLEQLVELAERFEPMSTLRATDFVRFVRWSRQEQASSAKVRLMTIHGAKGLQFDIVVLGDLDRPIGSRHELLIDRASPTEPIRGVYAAPSKDVRAAIPQLEPLAEQAQALEINEQLCKLYVAMTRPVYALHMLVRPLPLRRMKKTFGQLLCHSLAQVEEQPEGNQVLFEHGDPQWMRSLATPAAMKPTPTKPIQLNLPQAKEQASRSWLTVSPSSLERDGRVSATDLLRIDTHGGQQFGTLIHQWFSQVGFPPETPEGPEAIPDDAQLEGGDADTIAAFRKMLEYPAIFDALKRDGADELWREQSFAVRDGLRLLRGVFDRVHLYKDRAILIDFKTDRVEAGQLDRIVEQYRPQVVAYRRALGKMRGIEESRIECKLLFVGCGEVVVV